MASVKIQLDPEALLQRVEGDMKRRLRRAGEMLKSQIQRNISKPSRKEGPSEPGDFPHADTGLLRNSIFVEEATGLSVNVGSRLDYALYLELGTSRMAPRPYLRRTLIAMDARIRQVLTGQKGGAAQ